MSFNPAAYEALGSPETVELLYSAARKMIAIRAVDASSVSHAITLRGVGGKASAKDGKGAMLLAATAFCQTYDIDTTETIRRDVEVTDGVLLIDLNDPGVTIRGNRSPRKDAAAGEDTVEHPEDDDGES